MKSRYVIEDMILKNDNVPQLCVYKIGETCRPECCPAADIERFSKTDSGVVCVFRMLCLAQVRSFSTVILDRIKK